MNVYLNGRMVRVDQARIGHDDAGFQHAVGLFETMTAVNGRIFRLGAHLHRMARSARELGLAFELDRPRLIEAVLCTLEDCRLSEARVRLTVTAGRLSLLYDEQAGTEPTTLVVATPPTRYEPAIFQEGVTVLIAQAAANPFDPVAGHKTLAYWGRLQTLRRAASLGAAEAIWLNISNHLASGAVSNLFLVRDGTLLTPIAHGEQAEGALNAPVLPGITRSAVIELAQDQQLRVDKRMLNVGDLLDADEVFLTNSSWQILPVTRVEQKPIGDGRVGPVTGSLREALAALMQRETSGVCQETA